MIRQRIRRNNLSLILSVLELAGFDTPQAQANALGNIVTARKLTRMPLGADVPSMFARGVEHAFGVRRGWLDRPCNLPPALPKRLLPRVPVTRVIPVIADPAQDAPDQRELIA